MFKIEYLKNNNVFSSNTFYGDAAELAEKFTETAKILPYEPEACEVTTLWMGGFCSGASIHELIDRQINEDEAQIQWDIAQANCEIALSEMFDGQEIDFTTSSLGLRITKLATQDND